MKVLIIDDDPTFLMMLKNFLTKKDFITRTGISANDALQILKKENFDIILLDFKLPDKNGLDLLKDIKKLNYQAPVILMTSYADIKIAVQAIKQGAYDYISKPVKTEELLNIIHKALDNSAKKGKASAEGSFLYIAGKSEEAHKINKHIQLVAPTNFSVIIQGESGTGKEYVARMIHLESDRKNKPFVAIDCGALSKELAGSELFGHVKGSFTGALNDKVGQFEAANKGTLFLDEIGNLSYEIQVKLLRALQERKIKKIGSNHDINVDVRIIVATNEDLKEAVESGDFREDLYHRLNEFSINISPLRDRKSDIMMFADHFLEQANRELKKSIVGFDAEVKDKLLTYQWPGNIRELKNLIKRAVLLASTEQISGECLPREIMEQKSAEDYLESIAVTGDASDLKAIAEKNERAIILKTLEKVGYNKSKAARLMNIDRKTLYNKLKLYGLE
ncbi:MAG: sigma-54-dependent transcriptional regulator [Cyclobacteriaceae bacterium]